jgi:hypothetical protein
MTSNHPWWLAMPPAELAATILPLFGQTHEEHTAISNIVTWCKTGSYGRHGRMSLVLRTGREPFEDPDMRAIAEAIQVLEHAGLLMRSSRSTTRRLRPLAPSPIGGGNYVGLTRLGRHALQTNTVRQHLGLSHTPPTT